MTSFLTPYFTVPGLCWLIVQVLYLLALRRALLACSPSNRVMSPRWLWLELVPPFNLVWQFVNVAAVSVSFGRESRSRGVPARRPLLALGTVSCAVQSLAIVLLLLANGGHGPGQIVVDQPSDVLTTPFWESVFFVGLFLLVAGVVTWLLYWHRVSRRTTAMIEGKWKWTGDVVLRSGRQL